MSMLDPIVVISSYICLPIEAPSLQNLTPFSLISSGGLKGTCLLPTVMILPAEPCCSAFWLGYPSGVT